MMQEYVILKNKNDWLKDYKGLTYSDRLRDSITKGLIQEHEKKLNLVNEIRKKCLVVCLEPDTKEILSIGASSLLQNKKTKQIIENMILDNFGLFFQSLMVGDGAGGKDDVNGAFTFRCYADASGRNFGVNSVNAGSSSKGRMGSGSTPPTRADFQIQTALPTAPESGYRSPTGIGYTASNTIVYNYDASPTGGAGTVREAGTFGNWFNVASDVAIGVMLTHDAISPQMPYVAGKLLRASYTWVT